MPESGSRRPKLQTKDTFNAAQLSGTLSPDGIAALHPDHRTSSRGNGIAGSRDDYDTLPEFTDASASAHSGDEGQYEDDEMLESYDDLRPDPDTLISTRRSVEVGRRPTTAEMSLGAENTTTRRASAAAAANIQVRLERTGKQGHYVLTADDPELKDVLRRRLEREDAEAGKGKGKPRTRFRDLVFTRQCTHIEVTDNPLLDFICKAHTFFSQSPHSIGDMLPPRIVPSSASLPCSGFAWS